MWNDYFLVDLDLHFFTFLEPFVLFTVYVLLPPGAIPVEVGRLAALQNLNLSSNQLSGRLPP